MHLFLLSMNVEYGEVLTDDLMNMNLKLMKIRTLIEHTMITFL